MSHPRRITAVRLLRPALLCQSLVLLWVVAGATTGDESPASDPPASTIPSATDTESVEAALLAALDDERRAVGFYEAVLERHGDRRPFSNIVRAEWRHAAAIERLMHARSIVLPPDRWADHAFHVDPDFRTVCDESASSEIVNVAMYDRLLASVDDADVRGVFQNLRQASAERHLPAFRRHGRGWAQVEAGALTPVQRKQLERAEAARERLFRDLLGRLTGALEAGDAASAIEVCRIEAPAIADAVGEASSVRIGRTSFRLRNPANRPPAWSIPMVEARAERTALVADRAGTLGVLEPIHLAGPCLTCHGDRSSMTAGLRTAIDRHYPADEATGFTEGELRGWFWVEVPPAPTTAPGG